MIYITHKPAGEAWIGLGFPWFVSGSELSNFWSEPATPVLFWAQQSLASWKAAAIASGEAWDLYIWDFDLWALQTIFCSLISLTISWIVKVSTRGLSLSVWDVQTKATDKAHHGLRHPRRHDQGTHLSEVTRILSSLDELKWSSFSLKYSSIHCSSKSCTFLSSSSVMNSSVEKKWDVRQRSKCDGFWAVGLVPFLTPTKVRRRSLVSLLSL